MSKKYFFMLSLLFFINITGCAVNLNANKFSLNSICIRPHHAHTCKTILVANTQAQPGYETDQIIYVKCPYELKAFSQNRWVAPPHEMLTSLIAQSLRNTGYFKAVPTSPFAGITNYRLESRLLKLQQEFMCCPSHVRMMLHVLVIDNATNKALGERVFEAVILAPQNNPYSGVLAANLATKEILDQVADFVIATIECHPC